MKQNKFKLTIRTAGCIIVIVLVAGVVCVQHYFRGAEAAANENAAGQNVAEQETMEKDTDGNAADGNKDHEASNEGISGETASAEKELSEAECLSAMQLIQPLYEKADKGDADNIVISDDVLAQMMAVLGESGCPVSVSDDAVNMVNGEAMAAFLDTCIGMADAAQTLYELRADGGINRKTFIYEGSQMRMICTTAVWRDLSTPVVVSTSDIQVLSWKVTTHGWFTYELDIPKPPEVSELTNSHEMLRIQPLSDEHMELSEKYLQPVGYQGNNLFRLEWDEQHMENIDYNGLFEYLYLLKYKIPLEQHLYESGIPSGIFEDLITAYLPVSAEQLRGYAVYDKENDVYNWERLKCGDYDPEGFDTSVPEIADIIKNDDGTTTFVIDAVCELMGNDSVYRHYLTVHIADDGEIQFVSNRFSDADENNMPQYQYRLSKN